MRAVGKGLELARQGSDGLQHYDPDRGLKAVAVAEAAERHYRRARDATRLLEAVELKLSEQRAFVVWWDSQDKRAGSRGVGKKVEFQTGNPTLDSLGVDKLTLHRWRSRLKDDATFQATLATAQARCLRVCEAYRGGLPENARSLGTGEYEWYTPAEYVEAAREVLGTFDLDPASSDAAQRTVRAARYFTKADDGLAHPWPGRVWLNPPYSQPDIGRFVVKLVEEYHAGRMTAAILLTHNYTDNAWFHHAARAAVLVCFTRGRIAFVHASGASASPTQGQAFFYYGTDPGAFRRRFADVGLLMVPA